MPWASVERSKDGHTDRSRIILADFVGIAVSVWIGIGAVPLLDRRRRPTVVDRCRRRPDSNMAEVDDANDIVHRRRRVGTPISDVVEPMEV